MYVFIKLIVTTYYNILIFKLRAIQLTIIILDVIFIFTDYVFAVRRLVATSVHCVSLFR